MAEVNRISLPDLGAVTRILGVHQPIPQSEIKAIMPVQILVVNGMVGWPNDPVAKPMMWKPLWQDLRAQVIHHGPGAHGGEDCKNRDHMKR